MVDVKNKEKENKENTEGKAKKKFENKLLKYLRVFPRDELIAIRRFIISPYYNESQAVLDLFQFLRRFHYGGYTSYRLVNEVVFEEVFPNEAYNHRKLTNLCSDLVLLIEKYIAVKELESNQMTKHKVLIDAYGKRKQYELFEKEIEKGMKLVNRQKRKDSQYYKDRILLNSVMYEYSGSDQFKKDKDRLPNLLGDLNEYFYLMKLRYTVYYLNDSHLYTILEDRKKMTKELNVIGQLVDHTTHPLLEFYANLLKLQREDFKISVFLEMRNLFIKKMKLFPTEEMRDAYIILLNIITRIYNNKKVYLKELFYTQILGLEQKFLMQDGQLSDVTFLNIIVTGSKAKEFEQLPAIIKLNKKYLNEKVREDAIILADAYMIYHKKNYESSLQLLTEVARSTVNINLRSRLLKIRNYMEMLQLDEERVDVYDKVVSNCSLCIKFLKREKNISSAMKDRNLLFLRILKKIAITVRNKSMRLNKTQQQNEINRITNIEKNIQQNNVASEDWLIEQLDLAKK